MFTAISVQYEHYSESSFSVPGTVYTSKLEWPWKVNALNQFGKLRQPIALQLRAKNTTKIAHERGIQQLLQKLDRKTRWVYPKWGGIFREIHGTVPFIIVIFQV